MLIRTISRSLPPKMILRLSNLFLYPVVCEKNSTSPSQALLELRFARSIELISTGRKLHTAKFSVQTPISLAADGIPRVVKADAQSALFDYLHCTRGLGFLDAEHISKNSPRFLAKLIAKVENEPDVCHALTRLLRYHPINEFEPFLESLGLSPTDCESLLPRGMIFLSDNQALLDNFRTLSNYGIPRSKIGRMYKEVNELFTHELSVLDTKLRAYEALGMNRSVVVKLVTCCPQLLAGSLNRSFTRVLEKLNELGFDENWIGGHLSWKNTYNWTRIFDTLCFLREVGYTDDDMTILLRNDTSLLLQGSGKEVYSVVCALFKLGLNMKDIYNVVSENPRILSRKFAKNFRKALHFLFEIGMDPENTALVLSTHMRFFDLHALKGLKTVLKDFKNCRHSLCEAIKDDPSRFFSLAFKSSNPNGEHVDAQNPNHFVQKAEFLQRIGYIENSEEMLKALKMFRGRGDQLQERFDCLVATGLDYSTVSSMVKQAPTTLNQTKEVLEKKMDCLRSYLGYPVESIVGFPSYLGYDMGRIGVRFSMYRWLRERGAAKPMISVSTLLACSDARFVKYFVSVHPEGPAMWDGLKKSLSSG